MDFSHFLELCIITLITVRLMTGPMRKRHRQDIRDQMVRACQTEPYLIVVRDEPTQVVDLPPPPQTPEGMSPMEFKAWRAAQQEQPPSELPAIRERRVIVGRPEGNTRKPGRIYDRTRPKFADAIDENEDRQDVDPRWNDR